MCTYVYSSVCAGMREAWRWVSDIHFSGKMIKTICECDEGVRFSAYVRHGEWETTQRAHKCLIFNVFVRQIVKYIICNLEAATSVLVCSFPLFYGSLVSVCTCMHVRVSQVNHIKLALKQHYNRMSYSYRAFSLMRYTRMYLCCHLCESKHENEFVCSRNDCLSSFHSRIAIPRISSNLAERHRNSGTESENTLDSLANGKWQ